MEIVGGTFRDDVDDAAERVAAIERPLGPAEELDPVDVVQLLVGGRAESWGTPS